MTGGIGSVSGPRRGGVDRLAREHDVVGEEHVGESGDAFLRSAATFNAIVSLFYDRGLDVCEDEPREPPALLRLENVVLTPHIGSADRPTAFCGAFRRAAPGPPARPENLSDVAAGALWAVDHRAPVWLGVQASRWFAPPP